MEMKDKLLEICKQLNIEYVGIAPIGPYVELEKRIHERVEGGSLTGFESKDINKLINPRETMEDAESVIVCLFPYYSGDPKKGNISKYAHSKDYHIIIKGILDKIGELLKQYILDFKYRAFVDTDRKSVV